MTTSSNPRFYIGAGDTAPSLDVALFGGQTTAVVNLTGATVRFTLTTLDGVQLFDRSAEVFDATNGKVRYHWQPTDTAEPGVYLGRFRVTFPGGGLQSYPNDRYIEIEVT